MPTTRSSERKKGGEKLKRCHLVKPLTVLVRCRENPLIPNKTAGTDKKEILIQPMTIRSAINYGRGVPGKGGGKREEQRRGKERNKAQMPKK